VDKGGDKGKAAGKGKSKGKDDGDDNKTGGSGKLKAANSINVRHILVRTSSSESRPTWRWRIPPTYQGVALADNPMSHSARSILRKKMH
jgi:hypothetical protein